MEKMYSRWFHRVLFIPAAFQLVAITESCRKNEDIKKPDPFEITVPKGFPPAYISGVNPLTVQGIALGKKLFFDTILSSNGRSCNTCHVQELSFSIPNSILKLDPSHYLNIPPLINLAWNPDYDWVGGHNTLDRVAIGDFGPLFFNSDISVVLSKLSRHLQYPSMFEAAFPGKKHFTDGIMQELVSYALAQFLRTVVTSESTWDLYLKGKVTVSSEARYGHDIFMSEKGDCFHCHSFPLFTDNLFHNIGLDSIFTGRNIGRFEVSGNQAELGQFSTPTLRNIDVTAPYMHDGRLKTLEEVVEHYNSGVKKSATLDPIMTKAGKETRLHLTDFEKKCLVEFLKTLTDTAFLSDPRYKSPG